MIYAAAWILGGLAEEVVYEADLASDAGLPCLNVSVLDCSGGFHPQ